MASDHTPDSTSTRKDGEAPAFDAATIRESDVLPPLAQAIDNLILARLDEQMAHHHSMEHDSGWVEEEGWVNRTRAALANEVLKLSAPAPRQPDAAAVNAELAGRDFSLGQWEANGTLVTTPPRAEMRRRIAAGDFPITSRVIARTENLAYVPEVEAFANARLIAAAPDLYRELRHLVRLLEPVEDTLNVPGLATLNGARAALAKVAP